MLTSYAASIHQILAYMYNNIKSDLQTELQGIRDAGLYKEERIITTEQGPVIDTTAQ